MGILGAGAGGRGGGWARGRAGAGARGRAGGRARGRVGAGGRGRGGGWAWARAKRAPRRWRPLSITRGASEASAETVAPTGVPKTSRGWPHILKWPAAGAEIFFVLAKMAPGRRI